MGSSLFFLGLFLLALHVIDRNVREGDVIAQKAKRRNESYADWLKGLSSANAPKEVDLDKLPRPYRGFLVQRFRVGFWVAKTKVCRPYSK